MSQEDLPYIIADVLKSPAEQLVRIDHYEVSVSTGNSPPQRCPSASAAASRSEATGDGGYDALMQALKKAIKDFDIEIPKLTDYRVRIPPGGKTGALVETVISWSGSGARSEDGDDGFSTIGVDSDQMAAAVIATEKMLNAVVTRSAKKTSGRGPRKASKAPSASKTGSSARKGRTSK